MMRIGVSEKDILCEPSAEWMEGGKSEDGDAHISQEEKKPSKNQVIKLFMKLYEKKWKKRRQKRSPAR